MPRRPTVAVLGGTFDRLHAGHVALLAAAFDAADEVRIGLTTERYLDAHPKPYGDRIRPYASRRRSLSRWLARAHPGRPFRIVPLDDGFGGSVLPGLDVLVVSEETRPGADAVNRERRRRGLAPLQLVVVPTAVAEDLRPVSSRRVRAGVLTPAGRRRTPLRGEIAGADPSTGRRLRTAVERGLPGVALAWTTSARSSRTDPPELRVRLTRVRGSTVRVRVATPEGELVDLSGPDRAIEALAARVSRALCRISASGGSPRRSGSRAPAH